MAILTFTDYDLLIGGLLDEAKMHIEDGDISNGKVLLDWKSGSNVSILFTVSPLWEERKIEIKKAELTLSGLGNKSELKDSKVFKIINKYLTDFEIKTVLKESTSDLNESEMNYYINLAK